MISVICHCPILNIHAVIKKITEMISEKFVHICSDILVNEDLLHQVLLYIYK